MRKVFAVLLLAFLLGACSAGSGQPDTSGQPDIVPTVSVEAFDPVIQALAEEFAVSTAQITVMSYGQQDFPSSCLGLPEEGEDCLQAITPGYRLVLNTPAGLHVYHLTEVGDHFRRAQAYRPLEDAVVAQYAAVWEQMGGPGGICQRMLVAQDGRYFLLNCFNNGPLGQGIISPEDQAQLNAYLEKYAAVEWSFEPSAAAEVYFGRYILNGNGKSAANTTAQEEINDFLSDLFLRLLSKEVFFPDGSIRVQ